MERGASTAAAQASGSLSPYTLSWAISLSASVAVLLLSVFAVQHAVSWMSTKRLKSVRFLYFYQDEDGEATPNSIENASKCKIPRLSLVCTGLGMWLSILQVGVAIVELGTVQIVDWAQMVIWVRDCFRLYADHVTGHDDTINIVVMGCQISLALCASVLTLLIRRRPDVYRNGTVVDGQYSTSFLGWLSFTWTEFVLRMAKDKSQLQIGDLPELDYHSRTDSLLDTCYRMVKEAGSGTAGLWMIILQSQSRALLFQASITVASSFISFVPSFALLNILLALEDRQNGEGNEARVWSWVVGLGISVLATATLETLKFWISYNKLTIHTQQQLSVAIFDKASRVGGGSSETDSEESQEHGSQGPVHMAVVDAKNVADFVCFLFLLYEIPLKLTIASAFLLMILGWECLLACAIILLLVGLANFHTVNKYSETQGDLMQSRDHRLSMITEILHGIRHVKFSALEGQWGKRINQLRDIELRSRWSVYCWELIMVSMYFLGPAILSASSLTVYVAVNGFLSAATAFTSIAILNSIEVSLTILPEIISMFATSSVSMQRIRRFLARPEGISSVLPSDTIDFTNASVAWPGAATSAERGTLKDLNLSFPKNALSVIMGPTGAGKSLLLTAIIGECDILSGTVRAPIPVTFEASRPWELTSGIAYVPQVPWIERGTVKDNILFGAPFNKERYSKVLFACAMEKDLERLPKGDRTELGGNGANLSGGQKWRLCLARALYSHAHTLVLDDVFSAVDVHTRQHLYQHALVGELAMGRTRILATHHVGLCLPHAEYVVSLEKGILRDTLDARDLELDRRLWEQSFGSVSTGREQQLPTKSEESPEWNGTTSLAEDHQHDSGLYWGACKTYMKEGGHLYQWIALFTAFLGYTGSILGRAWWLNVWTSSQDAGAAISQNEQVTGKDEPSTGSVDRSLLFYLAFYLALSAVACTVGMARCYFTFRVAFQASRNLFHRMLRSILRAPLQWHDDVPFGQVLNRFSSDLNVVDSRMGEDLRSTFEFTTEVAMGMFAGILVNPVLLVVAVFLTAVYLHYSRTYLTASRQIKRLESEAKSPIFDHFDTCLSGLPVIKAFGKVDEYRRQFRQKVDSHARAFWHLWLLNRWLGFRINMIGAAFSALSAALVVSLKSIDASAAGFAISFTMEISLSMALAIRYYANVEQDMNSVERVLEYCDLNAENYEGLDAPADWPTSGRLEVRNLAVRYAPHLPPALDRVGFKIEGNERVGVVGRTGSGKSSLVNAMFRIVEPHEGKIILDGIDISKLRLEDLRSRLSIIPQSPVIFRGTVRSNMDPFNEYEDAELLHALGKVGWRSKAEISASDDYDDDGPSAWATGVAQSTTSQLERPVAEEGTDLSQGQRQLLCIAREIVRKPKVLLLDEATSAVDNLTDQLVQQSVRSAFSRGSTTLIVIAHRLSTVADFDSILVLDAGRVVEFGSPRDLLGIENGTFRGMVEQDAERDALKEVILGENDVES
ncbi:hypothetical protein ASPVEDRAFT_163771 [Aspergillus versicolor CBS 583.65]|uniref:Uncharacterized protein n=1 Tax=Aspergillus versicolor CBS 583.65 TaxID=1036611 RepID=A0A1L9PDU8_ASPVE|nr:uncharacterized protein ASPVEDRAFT_163771 [Aspergillus versicolor CBS 583.65]OJI99661.1 hypothetical protein ASPVEDRAFT_163771 [Aspergillus versicolor CBS 583.65]